MLLNLAKFLYDCVDSSKRAMAEDYLLWTMTSLKAVRLE